MGAAQPGGGMPFDVEFLHAVETLRVPQMGTENVGPLLYALVRSTRPRSVLEMGLGYTSPFLARALADNRAEWAADKAVVDGAAGDGRETVLWPPYFEAPYAPRLHAIDDFAMDGSSAPRVLEVLEGLGLSEIVTVYKGDFRGQGRSLDRAAYPLDFIWMDCGGPPEYVAFFEEYWPLVNPSGGILVLHYTYYNVTATIDGADVTKLLPTPVVNEIKKQLVLAGGQGRYEMMSLVEPWKHRQGSVTMIRRLAPESMPRNTDFEGEMIELFGTSPGPLQKGRPLTVVITCFIPVNPLCSLTISGPLWAWGWVLTAHEFNFSYRPPMKGAGLL